MHSTMRLYSALIAFVTISGNSVLSQTFQSSGWGSEPSLCPTHCQIYQTPYCLPPTPDRSGVIGGSALMKPKQESLLPASKQIQSADGSTRDNPTQMPSPLIRPPGKQLPVVQPSGKRYAIVLGISRPDLSWQIEDAEDFSKVLTDTCKFDEVVLRTNSINKPANWKIFEAELDAILGKANPEDVVLFFYAGHGTKGGILDIPGINFSAVDLFNKVQKSRAGHKFIFLDACNAGRVAEFKETFKKDINTYLFTSSTDNQASWTSGLLRHGVFTWCVLQGLGGAADDNLDGIVDTGELDQYLREECPFVWDYVSNWVTWERHFPANVAGANSGRRPFALAWPKNNAAQMSPPLVSFTNSLGMALMPIHPGSFVMGSPPDEAGRGTRIVGGQGRIDDEPQHEVIISRPFFMGKYEVTQSEYQQLMEGNPSQLPTHPIAGIYWGSALRFCKELSNRPLERKLYRHYRLPTEAEWEYACRAESKSPYFFGTHVEKLSDYAWWRGNSGGQTHAVGGKLANAWGLHDMSGNVFEWCADLYHQEFYRRARRRDPRGHPAPEIGMFVVRGGDSYGEPRECRSADRGYCDQYGFKDRVGFRVVCEWDFATLLKEVTLDLSGSKIDDADVVYLRELKALKQLYLRRTDITATALTELRLALPSCEILWDDPSRRVHNTK